jgi:hypothetical protein
VHVDQITPTESKNDTSLLVACGDEVIHVHVGKVEWWLEGATAASHWRAWAKGSFGCWYWVIGPCPHGFVEAAERWGQVVVGETGVG